MLRLSDYKFITISSLRQAVIKVVWICNPDNVNIRIYNPLCYKLYDFAGIIDVISALQMLILKRFGVQIRNDKARRSLFVFCISVQPFGQFFNGNGFLSAVSNSQGINNYQQLIKFVIAKGGFWYSRIDWLDLLSA